MWGRCGKPAGLKWKWWMISSEGSFRIVSMWIKLRDVAFFSSVN